MLNNLSTKLCLITYCGNVVQTFPQFTATECVLDFELARNSIKYDFGGKVVQFPLNKFSGLRNFMH